MRASWLTTALFGMVCVLPGAAQAPSSAEQAEARFAGLPPEQRAYERFRYWVTMQPPNRGAGRNPAQVLQANADLRQKYREYLLSRGFSEADADAQIKSILDQANRLEIERWNRILTAEKPNFNTQPNAFLVEMAKGRTPGAALDVGMGQGRNAIWLAQNGWETTGFDPAEKAVALANQTAARLGLRLHTQVTTTEKFDFGENRWDLILLSYAGARENPQQLVKALKPHGILVIEAFHQDAARQHSIGRNVLFGSGELVNLFAALRVVRYEEPMAVADFGMDQVRLVRYCGEKVE